MHDSVGPLPLPSEFAVHLLEKWLKCLIFTFVTVNSFRVLTLLIAILVYPKYVTMSRPVSIFAFLNLFELTNEKFKSLLLFIEKSPFGLLFAKKLVP